MNLPDMLIQALASSPGLLAAVAIVWLNAKQESTRQNREDRRDAKRMEHEKDLAKRYEDQNRAMLTEFDRMAERIEKSHRDIFVRARQEAP